MRSTSSQTAQRDSQPGDKQGTVADLAQIVVMQRGVGSGGIDVRPGDIAIGDILHIIHEEADPLRRQIAYGLGQRGDHQAFDDARLNAEPERDHQDRRQTAPEGRVPAVVARQRMKVADAAAGRLESLAAP